MDKLSRFSSHYINWLLISFLLIAISVILPGCSSDKAKNTAPVAIFTASPTSFIVSVDASSSNDAENGANLNFRWDWTNDGIWDTVYSTTKIASYTYTSAGTYTIKLEVKDSGGLLNTITKQVTVPSNIGKKEKINAKDGAVMVWVSGGTFTMGTPYENVENPATQQVTLSGYWIYKHEVTTEKYIAFCVATGRALPLWSGSPSFSWTGKTGWTDPALQQHPAIVISWFDCKNYADWAGVALPTEAQWEYAARGTSGKNYSWGGVATLADPFNGWDITKCANRTNSYNLNISTWPIGSFPKDVSWCGALDMTGNVSEWCADWYGNYSNIPVTDPTGPESGEYRIIRGGSWFENNGNSRGAYRDLANPLVKFSQTGFRCVSPGS